MPDCTMGNKFPETDEDVLGLLRDDQHPAWSDATYGIYRIFRKRDGLSVLDAYIATLNHVIAIQEGKA